MIPRRTRAKAVERMSNSMPAYASSGAGGDTVICLHGIGGRRDVWQPKTQTIVRCGFRAVAWDAPGYGDTPQVGAPSWDGFSAALLRLIDGLELEHCILLGHSLGGMIAQHFASRHGRRVKALILSATVPRLANVTVNGSANSSHSASALLMKAARWKNSPRPSSPASWDATRTQRASQWATRAMAACPDAEIL